MKRSSFSIDISRSIRPRFALGAGVFLAFLAGGYYTREIMVLAQDERYARALLAEKSAAHETLRREHAELERVKTELAALLAGEQAKTKSFAEELGRIAGTVGTLEKLSKTDKELLQKYSKVYFLNEHYYPERLVQLPASASAVPGREQWLHEKVAPRMSALLAAAEGAGVPLRIVSAYRSFDEQSDLKGAYTVSFGAGANRFSADQGYSEHQLGTTVDLTTPALAPAIIGFDKTPAYTWLLENAHRFGFVLSYPKGNDYYIFEPWHWRFVGVALATKLKNERTYFYDLDQREIDAYLVSIFD